MYQRRGYFYLCNFGWQGFLMIQVEALTKDFGTRRAIDELSFKADKGEILGFLGPNGAGKTTTMRILCAYMPPTSGTATVGGYDVVADSLEVFRLVICMRLSLST
jgi:ABC-2 type transport system ATP-binding protein